MQNVGTGIARHAQCPANGGAELAVTEPAAAEPVKVIWSLSDSSGASVQRRTHGFWEPGTKPDDMIRITIRADRMIRFTRTEKP